MTGTAAGPGKCLAVPNRSNQADCWIARVDLGLGKC